MKKSSVIIGLAVLAVVMFILIIVNISGQKSVATKEQSNPAFIENVIAEALRTPKANRPISISKCTYNNQVVYYLPPRMADIPSVLYNINGSVICSPDGGFTGHGDGKCADFFANRTNCEIIWQDSSNP